MPFYFFLLNHVTQDLYVSCQYRQRYVALKTVQPVIEAAVQAVIFQGIDAGFNG